LRDEDISEGEVARKLLGISLSPTDTASSISVVDVAAVMEKPGVQTPSRKTDFEHGVHDHDEDGSKSEGELVVEVKKKPPPSVVRSRRHAPPPIPPSIQVNGIKKLPPKTPPRRRTRLKPMASAGNLESEAAE
jgi:hypothetical protein